MQWAPHVGTPLACRLVAAEHLKAKCAKRLAAAVKRIKTHTRGKQAGGQREALEAIQTALEKKEFR